MNRTIFGGSLASVIFLIAGTYLFSNSPIMWLASTSLGYTIFRCLVAVALVVVLVTNPPRRLIVRALMGTLAAVMAGWGIALILGDSMHLLDIILFLELGFAFGLEALELNEEEIDERIEQLHHPEEYVPSPIIRPMLAAYWRRLRNYRYQQTQTEWRVV